MPIEEEVPEESETSSEVHMLKRKTTRLETVSTEEEEMKEDTKNPEEKEKRSLREREEKQDRAER